MTSGRYQRVPDPLILLPDLGRAETVAPAPVSVIVVHGGFWRERWTREHAEPQARAFADAGHAVALPEYLRVGLPGGGWPGTVDDLRSRCADLLGPDSPLPPERPVVLVGHSAGGHLAVLMAHALAGRTTRRLAGVVALAGVLDLALAQGLGLGDDAVGDFLGGSGQAPRDADPARLGAPPVPVRLVHGGSDDVVPPEVSRSYARAVGLPADALRVVDDADHMALITPGTAGFAAAVDAVVALR